jgi:predicted AAA+ superfamily ATPase
MRTRKDCQTEPKDEKRIRSAREQAEGLQLSQKCDFYTAEVIHRAYESTLRALLRRFPAVTVLGPRQCGRTTFIRRALPKWSYVDLERPADATPLAADPEARLAQLGDAVILDEAQHLPEIFPVLRGLIDRRRSRKGRFVLLGSASPSLVRGISESLAGRTAFLDLPPFRWDEVGGRRPAGGLATLWLRGGFPDAFLVRGDRARHDWMEAYTRAFIERDLPALGIDVSASQMRKLWTMVAHVNGGLWNASQLAASLGVSYHTVDRYVDILEQAFLVDQLLSAWRRLDPGCQGWFWRTAQADEVDLLIETGSRLVPFEAKLHSAPGPDEAKSLRRCMADLGLRRGYVVHPGRERYSLGRGVTALPAAGLLARPSSLAGL